MNINELKSLKHDKVVEAKKLIDSAEALGVELSDEQKDKVKTLTEEAGKLDGQIKAAMEREREAIATREALDAMIEPDSQPASGHDPVAAVGEPNWKKHPANGYETHSEFLLDVMKAGKGDGMAPQLADFSLDKIKATAGGDEASTVSDPYGGFTVPETLMPTLLTRPTEADPTLGRTTVFSMPTPTVKFAARVDEDHSDSVTGGLQVYWAIETQSVTATRPKTQQITWAANPLMGLSYGTDQLINYSMVSWMQLLAQGFGDEFKTKLFKSKISGTGVGMYLGVLNSDAKISVSKETGQVADTIVAENVENMRARCWGYDNAIWIANHNCYPQLARMSITVGTGGQLVYQPSVVEDRPDMLLGRPIYYSEHAKTVGDAGDLILCNWREYYEGNLGGGIKSASSIHVRFVNNETTFKFWKECDGRPSWLAALTPDEGDTLSPIVILAERAAS